MNIKTLLAHWPILALAFSSGGAFAYQEVQRQTLEQVIIDQAKTQIEQKHVKEAVIRLEEGRKFSDIRQKDIQEKLDMLIKMQLERK